MPLLTKMKLPGVIIAWTLRKVGNQLRHIAEESRILSGLLLMTGIKLGRVQPARSSSRVRWQVDVLIVFHQTILLPPATGL
jgi:hypothetical protein